MVRRAARGKLAGQPARLAWRAGGQGRRPGLGVPPLRAAAALLAIALARRSLARSVLPVSSPTHGSLVRGRTPPLRWATLAPPRRDPQTRGGGHGRILLPFAGNAPNSGVGPPVCQTESMHVVRPRVRHQALGRARHQRSDSSVNSKLRRKALPVCQGRRLSPAARNFPTTHTGQAVAGRKSARSSVQSPVRAQPLLLHSF